MKAKFFALYVIVSAFSTLGVFAVAHFAQADSAQSGVDIYVRPKVECSVSPTPPTPIYKRQTVTYTAIVSPPGDTTVYSFLWSDSESLAGNVGVATKSYTTTGEKSATVTVTPKLSVPAGVDLSNSATCTINVSEAPKPDLTASAPIPTLEDAGGGSYYANTSALLTGTVTNSGNANSAGNFTSEYSYRARIDANPQPAPNDDTKGTWVSLSSKGLPDNSTLIPGATRNVFSSDAIAFNPSTVEIRLCADRPPLPNGIISESNENNNCASRIITVVAKPTAKIDLKVKKTGTTSSPVDGPLSVNYQDSVELSWTGNDVTNCSATATDSLWTGAKSVPGTQPNIGPLSKTQYTFTISCTGTAPASNAGQTVTDSVIVNVGNPEGGGFNPVCQVSPVLGPYLFSTSVQWSVSGAPTGSTYSWGGAAAGTGSSSNSQTFSTIGTKTATVTVTMPGRTPSNLTCPSVNVVAPDLTASAPTPTLEDAGGGSYYANTSAVISGTVTNSGNANSAGNFTSEYSYRARIDANPQPAPNDDTKGTWVSLSSKGLPDNSTLIPGATRNVFSSDATAFNPSTVEIRLCADRPLPGIISESNENNNCASRIITVVNKPKLTVISRVDTALVAGAVITQTGGTTPLPNTLGGKTAGSFASYERVTNAPIVGAVLSPNAKLGTASFSHWAGHCSGTSCTVSVPNGGSVSVIAVYMPPNVEGDFTFEGRVAGSGSGWTYNNGASPLQVSIGQQAELHWSQSRDRCITSAPVSTSFPSGAPASNWSGTRSLTTKPTNEIATPTFTKLGVHTFYMSCVNILDTSDVKSKSVVFNVVAPDLTANAPTISLESAGGNTYFESADKQATLSGSVNNTGSASAPGTFNSEYFYRLTGNADWISAGQKGLSNTARTLNDTTSLAPGTTNRTVYNSDKFTLNGSLSGVSVDIRLCADSPMPNGSVPETVEGESSNCAYQTIVIKKRPTASLSLTARKAGTGSYGSYLSTNPLSVQYRDSIGLKWEGNYVSGCVASVDWTGSKADPTSTEEPIGPLTNEKYKYVIECTIQLPAENYGNKLTSEANVSVGLSTLSCAVSPTSGPYYRAQTSVQWTVSGAPTGATYLWSGAASGSSVSSNAQTFSTTGAKTATVTVKTAEGRQLTPPSCPQITVVDESKPDLTASLAPLSGLTAVPGKTNTYWAGDLTTIQGSVKNEGTAATANGSFDSVYYYGMDNPNAPTSWIPSIKLENTALLQKDNVRSAHKYQWIPNPSVVGSTVTKWYFKFAVDNPSTISESNDGNNDSNIIGPYIFEKKEPPVLSAPTPTVAGCTPQTGSNGLSVSWTSVPYATTYKLIAVNTQTLQSRQITRLTNTNYTDISLTPGSAYSYTVLGVSANGSEGPLSNVVSATVPAYCFDYSLSANSTTVEQNKSVTTTSTLTLLSGTARQVTLSITGIKAPGSTSFSSGSSVGSGSSAFSVSFSGSSTATPTATSNIKIDTKSKTPLGTYEVSLHGVGTDILAGGETQNIERDTTFFVNVYAKGAEPDVVCDLNAAPGSVVSGSSSTLTWSSAGAAVCTGTNFSTNNNTSGSVSTGALTTGTTYTLNCRNAASTKTCSKNVSVSVVNAPPPPPPPPPPPGEETKMQVSCFAILESADDKNNDHIVNPGEKVTWIASASGGTPKFNLNWFGSDDLNGKKTKDDHDGFDVQKISYSTAGIKTGGIEVTDSGNPKRRVPEEISQQFQSCEGTGVSVEEPGSIDFAIKASPSTIYIEKLRGSGKGPSTSATITIVPQGGFSNTISLSGSTGSISSGKNKANVSYHFGDGTLTSGEFSTGSSLTVTLDDEMPDGNYELTIKGDGGVVKTKTTTVLLQVVTIKPTFEEF